MLQLEAEVANGMVLLHRPELWGKLGMHLSVALSGSNPLTFTAKKPLGASQRGAGVGTRNCDSRYPLSYCSTGVDRV